MGKHTFKKTIYEEQKRKQREEKFRVKALNREGYDVKFIASWLDIPETIVNKYLKEKINDR